MHVPTVAGITSSVAPTSAEILPVTARQTTAAAMVHAAPAA
eukprot:CAMPEP_0202822872 /NCGR_PEP_ID=MMETSP1389-20130828/11380_1 /ASSEMBLY_ACC=CAM_ASM_000865 /TAXON_ID=302021 /ORGANISM="Rhodomonas sp., Strain CCMP768" /LENGTH=40 /DNA_ID= /DNA_START= /DNA_END= /DNA_ORIENTATION=